MANTFLNTTKAGGFRSATKHTPGFCIFLTDPDSVPKDRSHKPGRDWPTRDRQFPETMADHWRRQPPFRLQFPAKSPKRICLHPAKRVFRVLRNLPPWPVPDTGENFGTGNKPRPDRTSTNAAMRSCKTFLLYPTNIRRHSPFTGETPKQRFHVPLKDETSGVQDQRGKPAKPSNSVHNSSGFSQMIHTFSTVLPGQNA